MWRYFGHFDVGLYSMVLGSIVMSVWVSSYRCEGGEFFMVDYYYG